MTTEGTDFPIKISSKKKNRHGNPHTSSTCGYCFHWCSVGSPMLGSCWATGSASKEHSSGSWKIWSLFWLLVQMTCHLMRILVRSVRMILFSSGLIMLAHSAATSSINTDQWPLDDHRHFFLSETSHLFIRSSYNSPSYFLAHINLAVLLLSVGLSSPRGTAADLTTISAPGHHLILDQPLLWSHAQVS